MARERMVTRTISVTEVKVIVADMQKKTVTEKVVKVSGIFKDEKPLIKAVSKLVNTDTEKFVGIVETKVIDKLYGMPEQKFLELAEIIPEKESK